ncbi:unnamed protein product, partial [Amoebophrya sp. A25]
GCITAVADEGGKSKNSTSASTFRHSIANPGSRSELCDVDTEDDLNNISTSGAGDKMKTRKSILTSGRGAAGRKGSTVFDPSSITAPTHPHIRTVRRGPRKVVVEIELGPARRTFELDNYRSLAKQDELNSA